MKASKHLFAYRRSCIFLYGMTSRGFNRAHGLKAANAKTRAFIASIRGGAFGNTQYTA